MSTLTFEPCDIARCPPRRAQGPGARYATARRPAPRHGLPRVATLVGALLALALMVYGEQWLLAQSPTEPIERAAAACIGDIVGTTIYGGTREAAACITPEPVSTRGNAT